MKEEQEHSTRNSFSSIHALDLFIPSLALFLFVWDWGIQGWQCTISCGFLGSLQILNRWDFFKLWKCLLFSMGKAIVDTLHVQHLTIKQRFFFAFGQHTLWRFLPVWSPACTSCWWRRKGKEVKRLNQRNRKRRKTQNTTLYFSKNEENKRQCYNLLRFLHRFFVNLPRHGACEVFHGSRRCGRPECSVAGQNSTYLFCSVSIFNV